MFHQHKPLLHYKHCLLCLALYAIPVYVFANTCDGAITNLELISCSDADYKLADTRLNSTYSKLKLSLTPDHFSKLKAVQQKWIKFKENHCKEIYEGIFPGQEAPIERNLCFAALTNDRTNELIRLKNGASPGSDGTDNFSKTLKYMNALGYETGYITTKFSTMYGGEKDWNDYKQSNCEFSSKLLNDDYFVCSSRLNFYRSYY
jgi:uncharacterized protein YecT (DUF1311 family)